MFYCPFTVSLYYYYSFMLLNSKEFTQVVKNGVLQLLLHQFTSFGSALPCMDAAKFTNNSDTALAGLAAMSTHWHSASAAGRGNAWRARWRQTGRRSPRRLLLRSTATPGRLGCHGSANTSAPVPRSVSLQGHVAGCRAHAVLAARRAPAGAALPPGRTSGSDHLKPTRTVKFKFP